MISRLLSHWKKLLVVLVLAGGLLALVLVPGMRPRDFLLRGWRQQLARLPDDEAAETLQKIASLGESAIPDLITALGDPREAVARAARQLLDRQLDRWRLLPARDADPRVARLARMLARRIHKLSPAGRQAAAAVATQILLWPTDGRLIDSPQLIADCETVIRAASPQTAALTPAPWRSPADVATAGDRQPQALIQPTSAALATPGGELPVEMVQGPSFDAAPRLPDTTEPADLPRRPAAAPANPPANPPELLPRRLPNALPLPTPDTRSPAKLSIRTYDVRSMHDELLMSDLHAEESQVRNAARLELQRRGFGSTELAIGSQLKHPQVTVRRRLPSELSRYDVNPRPWLLALSRDTDRGVRRAAMAVMATSADPELQLEARRLAREAGDEPFRRMVEQAGR